MKQDQRSVAKIILALVMVGVVGLVGLFVFQPKQLRPGQVETNQPSTTPTNSPPEWPTFTHQLGYSFQYPPTLEALLLSNSESVVLRSTEDKKLYEDREFQSTIEALKNVDQLPLREFIEQREGVVNGRIPATAEYSGTAFFREIIAFEAKTVGGKPGYFFRADPCSICRGETYSTYIELSPTTVLNFDVFVDKQTGNTESYQLYDQILLTFKFKE